MPLKSLRSFYYGGARFLVVFHPKRTLTMSSNHGAVQWKGEVESMENLFSGPAQAVLSRRQAKMKRKKALRDEVTAERNENQAMEVDDSNLDIGREPMGRAANQATRSVHSKAQESSKTLPGLKSTHKGPSTGQMTAPPQAAIRLRISVLKNAVEIMETNKSAKVKKLNKHKIEIQQLEEQLLSLEVETYAASFSTNTPSHQGNASGLIGRMVDLPHRPRRHKSDSYQQDTLIINVQPLSTQPNGWNITQSIAGNSMPNHLHHSGLEFQPKDIEQEGNQALPRKQPRDLPRDKIVAPSQASGGVPEPSEAYILRSRQPYRQTFEPRHLLLVIDLNGTLLHRPDRRKPSQFVERPMTQLFLEYSMSKFQVMIWSSARPENVEMMCSSLFKGQARRDLVSVWGRDKLGLSQNDYNQRVQVYKRLETVWKDPQIQSKHPRSREGHVWDQSNTVLIDDSIEKSRSEPCNLVKLPEFTGTYEPPTVLRQLAEYLEILLFQTDVSTFISRHPFNVQNLHPEPYAIPNQETSGNLPSGPRQNVALPPTATRASSGLQTSIYAEQKRTYVQQPDGGGGQYVDYGMQGNGYGYGRQ